jgi:transcription antitermination factor NusG
MDLCVHRVVNRDSDPQPPPFTSAPHWFALRVKPQHEKPVARHLSAAGLESFLPLYRTRRAWSDRIKELELPLLAGYVFARFAFPERVHALRIPGVYHLVGFGGEPTAVPEEEIATLKRIVASGLPIQPWPYLRIGDWVRIVRGPLREIDGILVQVKSSWRVVVSVHLLQRSVAAEVDRLAIVPTTPTLPPLWGAQA